MTEFEDAHKAKVKEEQQEKKQLQALNTPLRQPSLITTDQLYIYIYRHDLASIVDLKISKTREELIWEIESVPYLEFELSKLNSSKLQPPPVWPTNTVYSNIISPLHSDAIVEELIREDHATEVGN